MRKGKLIMVLSTIMMMVLSVSNISHALELSISLVYPTGYTSVSGYQAGVHYGVDFIGKEGVEFEIRAAAEGTVFRVRTGCINHNGMKISCKTTKCNPTGGFSTGYNGIPHCNGSYGNVVEISHGNGIVTLYGHMTSINVEVGDKVYPGTHLGTMGSTGASTYPHLHFELHSNYFTSNPVHHDPWPYFNNSTTTYTVTFRSNGGVVSTVQVQENSLVPEPADPTRTGYTFGGWYKDSPCTVPWNFAVDRIVGARSIYAKWTQQAETYYTVTFRSAGGVWKTVQAKANSTIANPGSPTRAGYTFGGWFKDSLCNTPWNFAADRIIGARSIYAKWTQQAATYYTVTFRSAGGVWKTVQAQANSTIANPGSPTRTGYVFGGWFKDSLCKTPWNFAADRIIGARSIYAKWTPQTSIYYTVTFRSAGGVWKTVQVQANSTLNNPGSPTRIGYAFGGWFKDSLCTTPWNFATDRIIGARSIYAKWTSYSDFVPPGKSNPISPANGSHFTMPNMPTLSWSSVTSPSGGTVKYYAETYDCAEPQNSGWITGRSWRPTTGKGGLFNWHVKAIDTTTGKESGWGATWQFTMNDAPLPNKPSLVSPGNGSSHVSAAPTLTWTAVSSPSGGRIEYFAEIFDSPVYQNSGWITSTSWRPSVADGKPGQYNWNVKSIDRATGKESGWGGPWTFYITKGESTDLRLDIRRALYGKSGAYTEDLTQKVRDKIVNDTVSITVNNAFCGYDPYPNTPKQMEVTYRNRWNEEYRLIVQENSQLNLTRDDRKGTFLLDGDD